MALRTFVQSLTAAADGLEHAAEWALDRVFSSGNAEVFDFIRELIRVLDFHTRSGRDGNKIAPNRYTLSLRHDVYQEYASLVPQYEMDLTERLTQEIRARNYHTLGKIAVRIVAGDAKQSDEIVVVCVISADTMVVNPSMQLAGYGQNYPLRHGTTTVGRHPMNDITLADDKVSRHHAKICSTPNGYLLADLGSSNGTFLNEQRLQTGMSTAIHAGDSVRFGTIAFTVEHETRSMEKGA